jgi:hypothetical protein
MPKCRGFLVTINDKLTRGFLAGTIAGIAQSFITIPAYSLGRTKLRWLDFASIIVFNKRPKNKGQAVYCEIMTLGWAGLLGIVYTYALPKVRERNHRFKGILYGMSSWFSIYSIVQLLDVGKLMKPDRNTVLVHGIAAAVWGLVMDESINRLEHWTQTSMKDSSTRFGDALQTQVAGES